MADKDLKSATPDTSLPTDGFLFGADSQSATDPSIYPVSAVGTTLLGSTALTGATVTTSQPVLNLTQTWNAGAVTFTGLKFNATDTASASGSLLLDVGTGGGSYTSQFRVRKDGYVITAGAGIQIGTAFTVQFTASQVTVSSGFRLGWGSSDATSAQDLSLTRAAAATLQLGAADVSTGAVAQTLQVQSNTGASNGPNFTIKGSNSGAGNSGGSIIFQTATAGAYATALTIDSTKAATLGGNLVLNGSTNGSGIKNQGGSNYASLDSDGGYGFSFYDTNSATTIRVTSVSGVKNLVFGSTAQLAWGSSNTATTGDLFLARDAANTLALRNSTNAQTFRVYNTYTDASNWEAVETVWSSNVCYFQTNKAGTGTQRKLYLNGINITLDAGSGQVNWYGNLIAAADNTYDIGASGANRPRRLYVAGGSLTGSAADSSVEISPTWNTSGTPTAIKLNVTNTASASGSFLMSLQTGGTNQFAIKADNGACYIGVPTSDLNNYTLLTLSNDLYINSKSVTAGGIRMCHGTYEFAYFKAIGTTSARLQLGANTPFGWTDNAAAASGTFDTILSRAGVATLQLGAADVSSGNAVAQFLRVQSTTAASQTAPNFTIQGSRGTTAGGSIIFQTAATSTYTTALTLTPAQKAEFAATIKTAAPAGGTAAEWKLGTVATVSPTSPNRTIEVEIGGTTYYLHAKTTND